MKVAILAGGMGTRLAEVTDQIPKPMVEVGGRPLLWHILKHYSHYGFKEFFIALGYKGEKIKRFFLDYPALAGDLSIHLGDGRVHPVSRPSEDWTVHLIDTGIETQTGGRLRRLRPWLEDDTFLLTYGDGVSNLDLRELVRFHQSHGRLATVTAVRPPARFGGLVFNGHLVKEFTEKPQIGEGWINGGFMVFEPGVFPYLDGDDTNLEADALEHLCRDQQLAAFRHENFWQCVDTLRDLRLLEDLWRKNQAPWRIWDR